MALLARWNRWLDRIAGVSHEPPPARPIVEELEPRLLYSADSPLALAGSAAMPVALIEAPDGGGRHVSPASDPSSAAGAASSRPTELVFIDSAVGGWPQLLADIHARRGDVPVILLDASRDGIIQITEALSAHRDLQAVHLISHGSDGTLHLGATTVTTGTLAEQAGHVAQWRDALAADADLLLYGCDLAAGEQGEALVAALHGLTGADVAASIDVTGHHAAGGNWVLEHTLGRIEAGLAVSAPMQAQWDGLLATYTVTHTADDMSAGSLRWAITTANATVGVVDTIAFDIGAGGLQTIALTAPLPGVDDAVVIDGTTQPGYGGVPLIELSGANIGFITDGLRLQGGDSTVKGLIINGFAGAAIQLEHNGGNAIVGNYIGTDATGNLAIANGLGIEVDNTADNTIGGLTAAERNVISGNLDGGIWVNGSDGGTTTIIGNYIGTNADGTASLSNGGWGVIAGSYDPGDRLYIGGTAPGAGNLISGNSDPKGYDEGGGIYLESYSDNPAVIQGNIIGLDRTAAIPLPNGDASIAYTAGIYAGGQALIGGTAAGAGNVIAANFGAGIVVMPGSSIAMLGNRIQANSGLGIDLGDDGPTANAATAPQNGGNFPLLTLARDDGAGGVALAGVLDAAPDAYYRMEFYANPAMDGSGYGEGGRYLGHLDVATDGSGHASFSATLTATAIAGEFVTATATRSDATFSSYTATSEFSRNIAVLPNGTAQVTVDTAADVADGDTTSLSTLLANKGADGAISLREAIVASNNTAGTDTIRFQIGAGGLQKIVVVSALPQITDPVVIDGTTQGGYAGAPLIELDGSALGRSVKGLSISAGSSTIQGLVIGGFDDGIFLFINGGNTIVGNYIGTDATGLAGNGNIKGIAVLDVGNNTIGGVTTTLRNVIAGNVGDGISIIGLSTPGIDGNVILGNHIGVDAAGKRALINNYGIWVQSIGATNQVVIGGTPTGAGNLISGNNIGIGAWGGRVVIQGNVIGMNKDGTLAVPNGNGIVNFGGGTVVVGGTVAGAGNRIAGNLGTGIVDAAGNGFYALGNSIESNGGLGIDTFGNGVTQNVASGPRNFPILTAIRTDTDLGMVRIQASLYAAPSTYYRLEFFASSQQDPTGHGEGGRYLGHLDVVTLSTVGVAHLDTWIAANVTPGEFISATATRITDPALQTYAATSEFARSVVALRVGGAEVTVDTAQDTTDGDTTSLSTLLANKGPDGRISLREAVFAALATEGAETIRFQIGAGGLQTIRLASALPSIGSALAIDGTTQGGYSGMPLIQLDGSALGVGEKGLRILADNTVVRSLIFSGFVDDAIYIEDAGGTALTGNYIGTDASGLVADGGNRGVVVVVRDGGAAVVIGGTGAGEGNVIAGNNKGIHVSDGDVLIQGNIIGLDRTGTTALPNGNGIDVFGGSVTIGGIAAGAGNTIAGNTGAAIVDYSGRTAILRNAIHSNGGLGFDDLEDGVTPNAAPGPGAARNFPVLTLGRTDIDHQQVTIAGVLMAAADTRYRIEFYANGSQDATGYGEGARYLGYANVTTDAGGQAAIAVVLGAAAADGEFISATATRSDATFTLFTATSEFARNIVALPADQARVTVDTTSDLVDGDTTSLSTLLANKGADGSISLREAIEAANRTANGASPDRVVFGIPLVDANHLYYRDDGIAASFSAPAPTTLDDAAIGDFDADHPAGQARSWYRITLTQGELGIEDAVIIDGTTQSGYSALAGPVIEIDASGVAGNALRLAGGSSTVRGLAINGAPGAGIQVDASGAGSRIVGNVLGTDILGLRSLPNGINIRVAGDHVTIGGTAEADRNLIAGATGAGVGVDGAVSGVRILGNSIHGNGGLGIDLGLDGVTVNDAGDADAGPNGLLNFPVLDSAVLTGGHLRIDGVAHGRAGEALRIEFYANDAADPSGHGQGQRYLGFVEVVGGGDGRAAIAAMLVAAVRAGESISATATDSDGNTSEFAASTRAAAPAIVVTPAADLVTTEAGGTTSFSVVLTTRPTADVAIDIASSHPEEGTVSVARLTFTPDDWQVAQTVTVTGVQDHVNDGDRGYAIILDPAVSFDPDYHGLDPVDVGVTNAQVPNEVPAHALPASQATDEDTPLVFSAAAGNAIVITDIDAGSQPVQVTLSATRGVLTLARIDGLLFTAGSGTGDPSMTLRGTLADINAALDGLVYTPNADAHGAADVLIVTNDLGNTGTGGAAQRSDRIDITIRPVNDAPVLGTNDGLTLNEGGSAIIDAAKLHAGDADHSAAQLVYVLGPGLPAHGKLLLSGTALRAGDAFTQDDIDQGRLSYAHDGSESLSDGFDFELSDGSSSVGSQRFAITITPVNDAPVLGTNDGLTLNEGGNAIIDAAKLRAIDADHSASQLVYVLGPRLPVHGTLLLSGTALGAGDTVTQDDIDQGRLSYAHDGSESLSDGFDFEFSDGDRSIGFQHFTVTVTPVDDAPVLQSASGGVLRAGPDGALIRLDPTITDPDTPLLTEAVVRISSGYRSFVDSLALGGAHPLAAHWDPVAGSLTLSGAATAEVYEAALDDVRFTTTGHAADGRTLILTVSDGHAWSAELTQFLVLEDEGPEVPSPPSEIGQPVDLPDAVGTPPQTNLGPQPLPAVPAAPGSPATPLPSTLMQPAPGVAAPAPEGPAQPAPPAPGPADSVAAVSGTAPAAREHVPADTGATRGSRGVAGADRAVPPLAESAAATAILASTPGLAAADRPAAIDSWQIPVFDELVERLPLSAEGQEGSSVARHAGDRATPVWLDLGTEFMQPSREAMDLSLLSETTVGGGLLLSAGVLWWATRTGSLLAAMMASVPAWRSFDPLPILARGRPDTPGQDDAGHADDEQAVGDGSAEAVALPVGHSPLVLQELADRS